MAEPGTTGLDSWWTLDPGVDFMNHGSFGACPAPVLEAQRRLRDRLEREPVRFLGIELEGLMDAARTALGAFVGAHPGDIAFVDNATTGVNTALAAQRLAPGDELLVTDHEYNACRNALDVAAARTGAKVRVAAVPFPLRSEDEVVDAVVGAAGPATRLALVDHVTSPTGMVLPIARIVRDLAARGIDTLVDGAHAPGMLALDLDALGAAYYCGNCHKWLCTPKGSAFLWVRRDRQAAVRPLVISHGTNSRRTDRSRFRLEFDWTGTVDPTPWLCIPDAIAFLGGLFPGGWPEFRERNRAMALAARDALCGALGVPAPCPDGMIASMAAVPLPDRRPGEVARFDWMDPLQETLFERWRIEVPVMPWPAPPRRLVRVSCQAYNRPEQYERLARALAETFSTP